MMNSFVVLAIVVVAFTLSPIVSSDCELVCGAVVVVAVVVVVVGVEVDRGASELNSSSSESDLAFSPDSSEEEPLLVAAFSAV